MPRNQVRAMDGNQAADEGGSAPTQFRVGKRHPSLDIEIEHDERVARGHTS